MKRLVLVRHGKSQWNLENRFTGWTDVDLVDQGIDEAKKASNLLLSSGYDFDYIFTSVLKRAIRTQWIICEGMDRLWLPVEKSWKLNERHYGDLQGKNKEEMAKEVGDEQVHIWRRSYDQAPPALSETDPRHPKNEELYRDLDPKLLPATESLKTTVDRVIPFWNERICPMLQDNRRVLICAHGNSLRALVKHLGHIPDNQIPSVNIPTGSPLIFEFNDQLKTQKAFYLDENTKAQAELDQAMELS